LTDFESVRLLCGDRTKTVTRELVTKSSDAIQRVFQLNMFPLHSATTANTVLWFSGKAYQSATVLFSAAVGRFTLGGVATATAGSEIRVDYKYNALSSGDITDILSGHTGSPFLAASNACLVLAADATRLFMYTMGEKTVDKRRASRDLIELSKTLENRHYKKRDDEGFAASQFTFRDNKGTPYYNYDTSVAYLGTGV